MGMPASPTVQGVPEELRGHRAEAWKGPTEGLGSLVDLVLGPFGGGGSPRSGFQGCRMLTCCNTSELVHTGRRCSIQVSAGQGTLRGSLQPPSPARNPPGRTVHAPGRAPGSCSSGGGFRGACVSRAPRERPLSLRARVLRHSAPPRSLSQPDFALPTYTDTRSLALNNLIKKGRQLSASVARKSADGAEPRSLALDPFPTALWIGRRPLLGDGVAWPRSVGHHRLP